MGDTCPLLPPSSDSLEADAAGKKPGVSSLDDIIERIVGGGIGSAQLLQATIISFAWVFDAQQTFISVFTDAQPAWHCTGDGAADESCAVAAASRRPPCGLPPGSWAWDRSKHATVVSEWGLECSGPSVAGLPASAFFAGCLAGGLALATLADSKFGRKKMLFLSCLVMSLTGVLTVVSPNVWVYSALRFIGGFGRATIGTSALVLSTEMVGKKWRGEIGIIGFFCFTLGFLSLPAMGWYSSLSTSASWRTLYLWASVPALFYAILVYFLVRESPRWLLVRGRRDEAIETLRKISESNANSEGKTTLISFSSFSSLEKTWKVEEEGLYSALKTLLLEKRWASRRLTAVMIVGFGIGMIYYGMPLALGDLPGFNLYLSVTFNALSELPSALVTFFLIGRLNRRSSVLAFTLASGLGSVACVFLGGGGGGSGRTTAAPVRMGVEVLSFFSACTAFNVILIYTIELFPTSVRNSALSMVRQALVLGGVFAPMLVVAGRRSEAGGFLPFGVFGLVIGCCGLFVVCLPETRGGGICDTIEEQEYKEIAATAADNQFP